MMLPPLSVHDALHLLELAAGRNFGTSAERAAARELVSLVGQNPKAVRMLAGLLVSWGCSAVECLNRAKTAGPDPELDPVWRVSNLAYEGMGAEQMRTIRLLALIPTVPVDVAAAAVLTDAPEPRTSAVLGDLVTLGFLDSHWPRWYQLSRHLVASARRLADEHLEPGDAGAAATRLLAHYAVPAMGYARKLPTEEASGEAERWFTTREPTLFALVTCWGTDIDPPVPAVRTPPRPAQP